MNVDAVEIQEIITTGYSKHTKEQPSITLVAGTFTISLEGFYDPFFLV